MRHSVLAQRILIIGDGKGRGPDTPCDVNYRTSNACRDIDVPQINPICYYRWDCKYCGLYDSIETGGS